MQHSIKHTCLLTLMCLGLLLPACGSHSGSETSTESDDGTVTIQTSMRLVSSTLLSSASSSTRAMRLGLLVDSGCAGDNVQCVTPSNVSGKIYYSGIMVGDTEGYSVGPIVGEIVDPSLFTAFPDLTSTDPENRLYDFDLADQLQASGSFQYGGGSPYPADADAITTRIESYFAYIDASFSLTVADGVPEALVGSHIVRTVYGDIEGTSMKKGDLLYSADGSNFFWCTADETGCTHATRPDSPIQYATVVNYSGTPDGFGNQTVPIFAAQIEESSQITLTESELIANNWEFTVDFQMTNGIVFSEDLTTKTSLAEMVQVFQLAAEPGNQDGGFTATFSASSTPIETNVAELPSCADTDLGSEIGSSVYSGTTVGETNDLEPICGGSALGEDILFAWTAPEAGRYVVTWHGSYDPIVYILEACPASATEVFNVTHDCGAPTPASVAEVISGPLTEDQVIIIGVDGRTNGTNGSSGAFTLDIVKSICGDGTCREGEDFFNCPADC